MKYYIDTEFIEGKQNGFLSRRNKPTIDLISIGLVDENGREFYAISKEFNLKYAWNKYDIKRVRISDTEGQFAEIKVYWIRENVLKPIYDELCAMRSTYEKSNHWGLSEPFSYKSMKYLLESFGKTNKEIANAVCAFIYGDDCEGSGMSAIEMAMKYEINDKSKEPVFYGYYADYDWVVFCWLFGNMMDLPKGFPMYCRDLKQSMDELGLDKEWKRTNCPDPIGEHNALIDAKWNKELHNEILKLS